MIILYNSTMVAVPDGATWMIRSERNQDEWQLVLAVDGETVDTILYGDDYMDIAKEGEEDDWVLALFRQIAAKTAKELAAMVEGVDKVLDMNPVIADEVEFWTLVQEAL